jgi:hypothetical protein
LLSLFSWIHVVGGTLVDVSWLFRLVTAYGMHAFTIFVRYGGRSLGIRYYMAG